MRPLALIAILGLSLGSGLGLGLAGCAREERRDAAAAPAAPKTPAPAPADSGPAPATAVIAAASTAAAVEPKPATRSMAEFIPSRHGFAFVNSFSGSSLPVSLGAVEKKLGLPDRYGLCGGMSAAAADYFLARRDIPAETRPPARGTPLYTYLYSRQAASLGPLGAMSLKYSEWMNLSDAEVASRTRDELPRMVELIDRGEPVVLGLVLEGAGGTAWENHQVLACGAERRTGATVMHIYDPNYPGRDDVFIRFGDDGKTARLGPGDRRRSIRGVFRMPYEPAAPREPEPAK